MGTDNSETRRWVGALAAAAALALVALPACSSSKGHLSTSASELTPAPDPTTTSTPTVLPTAAQFPPIAITPAPPTTPTTPTPEAKQTCSAVASPQNAPRRSKVQIVVSSNVPSVRFSAVAHLNREVAAAGTTDAAGHGVAFFNLGDDANGRTVPVKVSVRGATCSTSFVVQ